MDHVKIFTEYQDELENIEIKKRTIYKDFIIQKPVEEKVVKIK